MKKIKIGNSKTEWNLIENSMEISALRRLEFNQYWNLLLYAGHDPTAVMAKFQTFKTNFNAENQANCLILMDQIQKGTEAISDRMSPIARMFALIVISEQEKTEKREYISEGYLDQKLNKMYDGGLTWGQVEETVLNFTLALSANSTLVSLISLAKAQRPED